MSVAYSLIILYLLIITVDSGQQTSCSGEDIGCTEAGGLWGAADPDLTEDFPSLTSLLTGDYQFPDQFFTEFCKAMKNKHGDPGLPHNWLYNDITLIERLCQDMTAQDLEKLVPCANDADVRQSILQSVADNTDIPPPRNGMTAEEAQKWVCRISTMCLRASLGTVTSSCDPRGVEAAVGVMTDVLRAPADYNLPLLDLGDSCLADLLQILQLHSSSK